MYEGLDPSEIKSTIEEVSDAVRGAANRVGDAIEKGKETGMPLSILSNIAREAPLGSCWSRSCWVWLSPGVAEADGVPTRARLQRELV